MATRKRRIITSEQVSASIQRWPQLDENESDGESGDSLESDDDASIPDNVEVQDHTSDSNSI